MSDDDSSFEGWAILELMGHRRLAGFVSEATIGGASLLRIDVPHAELPAVASGPAWRATQYYSPAAIYCITPTTEDLARAVAARNQPAPVQRWELTPPSAVTLREVDDDLEDDQERY